MNKSYVEEIHMFLHRLRSFAALMWAILKVTLAKNSVFTDKVERNCHFPAPDRNCYKKGKLILLFL
jgi:hypothetical protein